MGMELSKGYRIIYMKILLCFFAIVMYSLLFWNHYRIAFERQCVTVLTLTFSDRIEVMSFPIFSLNLILPVVVVLFAFSVEPWYNGNCTIQGITDYIHEYRWVFIASMVAAFLFLWKSPSKRMEIKNERLKSGAILWGILLLSFFFVSAIGYIHPSDRWLILAQTPFMVRVIRFCVVSFVVVLWKSV